MTPWNEARLHAWLARQPPSPRLAGSAMHDAAVLRGEGGARLVLCADQCIEGVHFTRGAAARDVGRKAAHRALSDLAAAAAEPRALLLAIHAPRGEDEARLVAILRAVRAAGRAFGADLVGGDLTAADAPLALTVTAQGVLPGVRRAPGRDRARPGQALVLTGPVGGSLAEAGRGRAARHLRFLPRLALGRALHALGATAAMDVSDGLALDLDRMARASGAAFEVDVARIPIHADARRAAIASGRSALDHALHDGEDHELVAALAPAKARAFERAADLSHASSRGARPAVIGRVVAGSGLWLAGDGATRRWLPGSGGWIHGG